ncbi:IncL/M type plasmid replication protein RepC, partial [Serratia sp. IR-2025]
NDVTLKMPAFEWVHVQLHQQKGMISLSPPTICNSAQKSNPEFQREYRNRIRETHDQLNLYLPKDAKRMLIEITKVKKLTQAEVIEFLVKSYYDGLKFDDSEE